MRAFFAERCYKSLTVLSPHLREHPFPNPFALQPASPGAPQPEAAGSMGRLGEEEFSSQQQLTPACRHPGTKSLHGEDQPGTPVTDTVIKRSKRNVSIDRELQTSWSFSFNMQQDASLSKAFSTQLEESKWVLLFELAQHRPVSQEQVKEATATCCCKGRFCIYITNPALASLVFEG